jgi:hypothetical protein
MHLNSSSEVNRDTYPWLVHHQDRIFYKGSGPYYLSPEMAIESDLFSVASCIPVPSPPNHRAARPMACSVIHRVGGLPASRTR